MSQQSGNGTVTISGGKVTAVGGSNAAGIGGGGGYQGSYISLTGGTGSVTISGGIVDAKGGAGNDEGDYAGAPIGNGGNATATATVNKTTGIIFENGVGTVCGDVTLAGSYTVPAGYSLHIPAGASLSGSGTLSGGETFTTDLSEDMISVPEDLYYDGTDRTAVRIDLTLCTEGQTRAMLLFDDSCFRFLVGFAAVLRIADFTHIGAWCSRRTFGVAALAVTAQAALSVGFAAIHLVLMPAV